MNGVNFTSNFLGILKKQGKIDEITDNNGVEILTIHYEQNPEKIYFSKPKLLYDKDKQEDDLLEPEIRTISRTLQTVRELGFEIISLPIKRKKMFKGQHALYKLKRKSLINNKDIVLNQMPKVVFEYDVANERVRLVGKNCCDKRGIRGKTDWIYIKGRKHGRPLAPVGEWEKWKNFGEKKILEKQFIKDIPVMIGVDDSIICIPHRDEPNNIAFVGKKGKGKSLLIHRVSDEIFWFQKEKVIIMNDIQEECMDWNKHQENSYWIEELKVIDEIPLALPIIYVYPHTNTLNLDYSKMKEKVNFVQITIPFSEVIEKAEIYLKLGGTAKYMLGIKDELLDCRIPSDVENLIEEKYPEKRNDPMKNKMLVSFDNVFNEEILNITNKEYPYKLSSGEIEGNPLVVLAKIGVVPCFETSDLFTKRYMSEVFAYHLNSIFQSKFRGKILEGETVYIVFDELTQICDDAHKNSAYDSLCTIATRGRKYKLGIMYATQNYSKIPRKIKSNTDFVFAFQHSNEEEVNEIKKDWDLGNLDKKEIMNLKSMEMIGITNEHFVCYKDGEKWEERKPVRGMLIPPISNHLPPK